MHSAKREKVAAQARQLLLSSNPGQSYNAPSRETGMFYRLKALRNSLSNEIRRAGSAARAAVSFLFPGRRAPKRKVTITKTILTPKLATAAELKLVKLLLEILPTLQEKLTIRRPTELINALRPKLETVSKRTLLNFAQAVVRGTRGKGPLGALASMIKEQIAFSTALNTEIVDALRTQMIYRNLKRTSVASETLEQSEDKKYPLSIFAITETCLAALREERKSRAAAYLSLPAPFVYSVLPRTSRSRSKVQKRIHTRYNKVVHRKVYVTRFSRRRQRITSLVLGRSSRQFMRTLTIRAKAVARYNFWKALGKKKVKRTTQNNYRFPTQKSLSELGVYQIPNLSYDFFPRQINTKDYPLYIEAMVEAKKRAEEARKARAEKAQASYTFNLIRSLYKKSTPKKTAAPLVYPSYVKSSSYKLYHKAKLLAQAQNTAEEAVESLDDRIRSNFDRLLSAQKKCFGMLFVGSKAENASLFARAYIAAYEQLQNLKPQDQATRSTQLKELMLAKYSVLGYNRPGTPAFSTSVQLNSRKYPSYVAVKDRARYVDAEMHLRLIKTAESPDCKLDLKDFNKHLESYFKQYPATIKNDQKSTAPRPEYALSHPKEYDRVVADERWTFMAENLSFSAEDAKAILDLETKEAFDVAVAEKPYLRKSKNSQYPPYVGKFEADCQRYTQAAAEGEIKASVSSPAFINKIAQMRASLSQEDILPIFRTLQAKKLKTLQELNKPSQNKTATTVKPTPISEARDRLKAEQEAEDRPSIIFTTDVQLKTKLRPFVRPVFTKAAKQRITSEFEAKRTPIKPMFKPLFKARDYETSAPVVKATRTCPSYVAEGDEALYAANLATIHGKVTDRQKAGKTQKGYVDFKKESKEVFIRNQTKKLYMECVEKQGTFAKRLAAAGHTKPVSADIAIKDGKDYPDYVEKGGEAYYQKEVELVLADLPKYEKSRGPNA